VLGHVALVDGDENIACKELLLAGAVSGSPVLGSFDPDMSLAHELLQLGQRATVIEYFALCEIFWKHGASRLAKWTDDVVRARKREFDPNLLR